MLALSVMNAAVDHIDLTIFGPEDSFIHDFMYPGDTILTVRQIVWDWLGYGPDALTFDGERLMDETTFEDLLVRIVSRQFRSRSITANSTETTPTMPQPPPPSDRSRSRAPSPQRAPLERGTCSRTRSRTPQ